MKCVYNIIEQVGWLAHLKHTLPPPKHKIDRILSSVDLHICLTSQRASAHAYWVMGPWDLCMLCGGGGQIFADFTGGESKRAFPGTFPVWIGHVQRQTAIFDGNFKIWCICGQKFWIFVILNVLMWVCNSIELYSLSVWFSGSLVAPGYLIFVRATSFWFLVARLGYQEILRLSLNLYENYSFGH